MSIVNCVTVADNGGPVLYQIHNWSLHTICLNKLKFHTPKSLYIRIMGQNWPSCKAEIEIATPIYQPSQPTIPAPIHHPIATCQYGQFVVEFTSNEPFNDDLTFSNLLNATSQPFQTNLILRVVEEDPADNSWCIVEEYDYKHNCWYPHHRNYDGKRQMHKLFTIDTEEGSALWQIGHSTC